MKLNRSESLVVAPVDALSEVVARDAADAMAKSASPLIRSVGIIGAMVARVGGDSNPDGVSDEIVQLFRAKSGDLGALIDFLKPESLKAISSLDGIMNIPTDEMAGQLGHLSKTGPIAALFRVDNSKRGRGSADIGRWFNSVAKKADRVIANRLYRIPDELLNLSEIPQVRGQFMLLWQAVEYLNRAHQVRMMAEESVESLLSAGDDWATNAKEVMKKYRVSASNLLQVERDLNEAIDEGLGLNLAETQHGSEEQVAAMETATAVSGDTASLQRQFVEQNKVITRAVMDFHRHMVGLESGNADLKIRQGILTAAMLSEHAAGVVVESTIRATKTMLASMIRTRMQAGARCAIGSAVEYQTALSMATETALGILSGAEEIARDAATKGARLLPEGVVEGEFRE